MKHNLLSFLTDRKQRGLKSLAVLVDPDKTAQLDILLDEAKAHPPDLFLVGSSFKGDEAMSRCIEKIRSAGEAFIGLFPGNMNQVVPEADALLLLSVISSRNPDLLIGRHVEAAYKIRSSGLSVVPTGYILIESGRLTSVQYMSQSLPVPRTKPELAAATAMAGEQLGMKLIYLEAGSGAEQTVPEAIIRAVKGAVDTPLITGGGIITPELLDLCYLAGADVAVVGNALEQHPALLSTFTSTRDRFNS